MKRAGCFIALLLFVGASALALALAIDPLVTARAREALEEQSIVCDDRFHLRVTGVTSIEIDPCGCRVEGDRPIEWIAIEEPIAVDHRWTRATAVRVPAARVGLRSAALPATGTALDALVDATKLVESLGRFAFALIELERMGETRPELEIALLALIEGSRTRAVVHGLAVDSGTPMVATASRIDAAALPESMRAIARVFAEDFAASIDSSTATLRASVGIEGSVPMLGALSTGRTPIHLRVEGLDRPMREWRIEALP